MKGVEGSVVRTCFTFRTFVATFVVTLVEIPIRNRDDKGCDKGCDQVFPSPGFGDRLHIAG